MPQAPGLVRDWRRVLNCILGDAAADLSLTHAALRVRQPERLDQSLVREQRALDADGHARGANREHAGIGLEVKADAVDRVRPKLALVEDQAKK